MAGSQHVHTHSGLAGETPADLGRGAFPLDERLRETSSVLSSPRQTCGMPVMCQAPFWHPGFLWLPSCGITRHNYAYVNSVSGGDACRGGDTGGVGRGSAKCSPAWQAGSEAPKKGQLSGALKGCRSEPVGVGG